MLAPNDHAKSNIAPKITAANARINAAYVTDYAIIAR